ncbi:MAG: hypothetical protein ACK5LC_17140, partial [Coprobacillaceae bacterium]
QLKEVFAITLDQLVADTKDKEDSMPKAILFVRNYMPVEDEHWGYNAKDYATNDLIKNLTEIYPNYDWRPAKADQIDELISKNTIDYILVTPAMRIFLKDLVDKEVDKIEMMQSDMYAKITKLPFSFLKRKKKHKQKMQFNIDCIFYIPKNRILSLSDGICL